MTQQLPTGLSITDVFTPAPSGVGPVTGGTAAVPAQAPAGSWLATLLQLGATVGLSTTSWQPGGITRTELAIMASALMLEDINTSIMAQGTFLDFASTGSVTYVDPLTGNTTTRWVTPDPANPNTWPNPSGTWPGPGWLDILADSGYNVQRIGATQASGTLTFANTTGSPIGPFVASTYHVANTANGATYSNTSSLTINASSVLGGSITAVTSSSGVIQVQTSSAHGLSAGQAVYIAGVVGTGGMLPGLTGDGFGLVTVVSATQFLLNGSVFVGSYTGGGTVYSTQQVPYASDLIGSATTAPPRSITRVVTQSIGVSCTNFGGFTGQDNESNARVVNRCRAKLATLSPNGPKGAYTYYALSAYQLLSGQVEGGVQQPPTTSEMTQAITQVSVVANTTNGSVTVTVGNASSGVATGTPVVGGVAQLPVQGATAATPIVIAVPSTSGIGIVGAQAKVLVQGVGGNTAANGFWTATVVDATHISLNGSVGVASWTSGGIVEAGDLGLVDSIIQSNVVPNAITASTMSALALSVVVLITVWVPVAQAGNVVNAVSSALAAFFPTIPIGGYTTGVPVTSLNTLPIDAVKGVAFEAASYIRDLTVLLNGSASDIAVPAGYQANLAWSGGTPQTGIVVNVF